MPPSATSPATASNLIDEFLSGAGLTAPAVAKILSVGPRQQPTDSSVIHRWMTEGVTTSDDRRIVLESAIVGGRRLTTRPALARFILAQNGGGE